MNSPCSDDASFHECILSAECADDITVAFCIPSDSGCRLWSDVISEEQDEENYSEHLRELQRYSKPSDSPPILNVSRTAVCFLTFTAICFDCIIMLSNERTKAQTVVCKSV